MIVGQEKLINKLNNLQELPRFIIFNGLKGCGKKTLGNWLAKKFNYEFTIVSNKIDDIREMIDISNDTQEHVIFYIDNGNQMSINALNSLLKITEETPNHIHIILGVENKELIIPTLLSRATIYNFEEYGYYDFKEYLQDDFDCRIDYEMLYPNFSYLNSNVSGLIDFCNMLLRKIDSTNISKYTSHINLKDSDKEYDLFQVIWVLTHLCYSYEMYDKINILNEYKEYLINKSYNKKYIFEGLIMKFQEVI